MRNFLKFLLMAIILIAVFSFLEWRVEAFCVLFVTIIASTMFLTGHAFEIIMNKIAMRIIIHKNHRRPHLFNYLFPFVIRRRSYYFIRTFIFTKYTLYKFGNPHDLDVNKLFGLSGGFNHFENSIRFGWNCDYDMQKINIFAYQHMNGKINFHLLTSLNLDEWYTFEIAFVNETAALTIYDDKKNRIGKNSFFIHFRRSFIEYKLGVYFGGELRAPKDIIFYKN